MGAGGTRVQAAIELNPNYSTAPHWYSICLLSLGRIDEALAEIKHAHELDPLSSPIGTSLTYAYFSKDDLNAAIAQCKAVIDLDPNYPRAHEYLGLGYLKKGLQSEAIAEFQKAVELSGRERRPLRDLGYGYAIAGKHAEALSVLKELEQKYERHEAIGQDLAAVYAGLGEKDQAFAWLEKDFQGRSGLLAWIRWTPAFESLRATRATPTCCGEWGSDREPPNFFAKPRQGNQFWNQNRLVGMHPLKYVKTDVTTVGRREVRDRACLVHRHRRLL